MREERGALHLAEISHATIVSVALAHRVGRGFLETRRRAVPRRRCVPTFCLSIFKKTKHFTVFFKTE